METNNIKTGSLKAWILAARPKTLTGAAVPVMIGLAMASADSEVYQGNIFNMTAASLCFLFAFIMQIDANLINDYFDFMNGTDDAAKRLGPRRACAQGWISVRQMKRAIAITTCLACATGLPLVFYGGIEMILVGIVCVIFCFLYTTHLSYIGLGDILVFVFFGIVPVCISYYIQLHTCTWQVFIISIACGFVIDSLLIINNYRDRDTDRESGKNTIIVRLGGHMGRILYLSTGIIAFFLGIVLCFNGHVLAFLLPGIYLALHISTYRKIARIKRGKALNMCLCETARNIFIYGLTVTAGLLLT